MQNFEEVYKELGKLFIEKLPTYIEKINEKKNDGLIIQPFNNTSLEENCIKQPCFKLTFTGGEYSEKDRIIENEVYTVSLEIFLKTQIENIIIAYSRYVEALQIMLNEEDCSFQYKITKIEGMKVFINIISTI